MAYAVTLTAGNWTASGEGYVYNYANTEIICGKGNNIPPIIHNTSNSVDYNKIVSAEATPRTGVVFTSNEAIEADIGVIIVDVK